MRQAMRSVHDLGSRAPASRRWPWALAAALAGAAAGAGVAYAARGAWWADRPGAVDPEQVEAVVDRPDGGAPPPSS